MMTSKQTLSPVVVGIDPGVTGAMAAVSAFRRPRELGSPDQTFEPYLDSMMDIPTYEIDKLKHVQEGPFLAWLREIKARYGEYDVYIERAQAAPAQNVSSIFNYGMIFGETLALASLVARNVIYVSPVVWKRRMLLTPDKERSRNRAIELFGDLDDFKRKRDHNRAEAALLALYAWKHHTDRHNPES
jgi:crossover junction endodeoxyribonuclease RuvC